MSKENKEYPNTISDELADFLKVEHGTKMDRTVVTKRFWTYIINNNLIYNHRVSPDETLIKLFKLTEYDVLSVFNLQKYIGPHFPKKK